MVKRSGKHFRFKVKQSVKTFISFRFEAKRKIFGSETKRKYALLILLRSEAKNLKRKEAKKNIYFSHERAKRMRNGYPTCKASNFKVVIIF